MPRDSLLLLQTPDVTKTASFNSTGVSIAGVKRSGALYARIRYSAGTSTTANSTLQFKVQHSDDNATFYDHVVDADQAVTLTTTAKAGVIYLPISTDKKYVRLAQVITPGGGASPTVTYGAEIVLSKV